MKRGDVWWVKFGPAVSGEIRKRRAAVVVINVERAVEECHLKSHAKLAYDTHIVVL